MCKKSLTGKLAALLAAAMLLSITAFCSLAETTGFWRAGGTDFTGQELNKVIADSNMSYNVNGNLHAFAPVNGKFGKASEDTSLNLSVIENSTYSGTWLKGYADIFVKSGKEGENRIQAGDVINIHTQLADSAAKTRSLELVYYLNGATDGNGSAGVTSNPVSVSADGRLSVLGKDEGQIPGYKMGRWYDFDIYIKVGESTAAGDAQTTPNSFSLYVDGIPYALNREFTIEGGRITGIRQARFNINAVKTDSGYAAESYYLDNFYVDVYKAGAEKRPDLAFAAIGEAVSLKNDGRFEVTEGTAVPEFLQAVSGNIASKVYLDNDFVQVSSGRVENGYLKVTDLNGREYFRDVVMVNPNFWRVGGSDFTGITSGAAPADSGLRYNRLVNVQEYDPITGAFGKMPEDTSLSIGNDGTFTGTTGYIYTYLETNTNTQAVNPGDTIQIRTQMATGYAKDRWIELVFFLDGATSGNGNYLGSSANILYIKADGSILLMGDKTAAGKIPNYRTDRWYDINIQIKTAVDGAPNLVSVYVDGLPVAQNKEAPLSGKITDIRQARTGYRMTENTAWGGTYAADQMYLDNFYVDVYTKTAPGAPDLNLSLQKDGMFLSNQSVIMVTDQNATVADLLDGLRGNFTAAQYMNQNYQAVEGGALQNGCLRLLAQDGSEYFRDVLVLPKELANHKFDEKPESPYSFVNLSAAHELSFLEKIGGKKAGNFAAVMDVTGFNGTPAYASKAYFDYTYPSALEGSYTFELAMYNASDAGAMRFVIPYDKTDGSAGYYNAVTLLGSGQIKVNDQTQQKLSYRKAEWVKAAVTVDTVSHSAAVYLNGKLAVTHDLPANISAVQRLKLEFLFEGASEERPLSGRMAIDDFRLSVGAYDPSGDTIAFGTLPETLDADPDGGKLVLYDPAMSAADFIRPFGDGAQVFDDRTLSSTEYFGYGIIMEGQVLVAASPNQEAYCYLDIKTGTLKISDLTFSQETVTAGEITASTKAHNFGTSAQSMSLIVACYQNGQLKQLKMQEYSVSGQMELSVPVTVTAPEMMVIKAFLVEDLQTLRPLAESVSISEVAAQ